MVSRRISEPIRMSGFLLPLLLGIAAALAAPAPSPACEPDYEPRCKWIEAGDAPLSVVAARGDETLRFDYSAFLRPGKRFSIEVSRDAKGVVRIAMHAPLVRGAMVPRIVPASAWPRFVALRVRVIAADAAARARIKAEDRRRNGAPAFVDCFDPGMLSIASALGRKMEQIGLNSCATQEVDDLADQVRETAYDLLPFCRKARETVSFGCGSLAGDGDVAAHFSGQVLATVAPCAAEAPQALAPGAVLRMADSKPVRGREILKTLCAGRTEFEIDRITASHDVLMATGRAFQGAPAGGDPKMVAAMVQVWHIDAGLVKLEQWTIGKFEPYRAPRRSPAPMPK